MEKVRTSNVEKNGMLSFYDAFKLITSIFGNVCGLIGQCVGERAGGCGTGADPEDRGGKPSRWSPCGRWRERGWAVLVAVVVLVVIAVGIVVIVGVAAAAADAAAASNVVSRTPVSRITPLVIAT